MSGTIQWFVRNPIAANLLMVLIIVGGFTGIPALDKQYFPDFELDVVSVTMSYLGAGPKEVEEQICIRIEEAVHDLNGVKEIRSRARQGSGTVLIEAESGYDMRRLTAEIKSRVDAINTFPAEAERPIVTELAHRHEMLTITVAGDIGEGNLKSLGESLRDELSTLPNVSVVELSSPRPYEVSVEVSEYTLRRYGLRFGDVVEAIRRSSLNLPAGAIKAAGGDIQLQTRGQAYQRADFEEIVLLSKRDGTRVLLGDVATVVDGFADVDVRHRFNDKPSHDLEIYVTSAPNVLSTDASVRDWLQDVRQRLPPGVELSLWHNQADPFRNRVDTLVSNGVGGLILVFLVLLVFLRPLLAMWVCVGIAVAFLGCLWMLQYAGVSLNMVSLFSFILILGIVVDDAIIVSESVHARQSRGQFGDAGAIAGTHSVVKPVMFAVISTMIFFAPMYFMPGDMAKIASDIPTVVILALTFSLIECLWILPAHLAHMRPVQPSRIPALAKLELMRERCADALLAFATNVYRPFLHKCLRSHLLTLSVFMVVLLMSLAIYAGGWVRSSFFPEITADSVVALIVLQEGGAFQDTLDKLHQVEAAAVRMKTRYNNSPEYADLGPVIGHISSRGNNNTVRVRVAVNDVGVASADVAERWREQIGDLGEVEDFSLNFTFNDTGKPIKLVLAAMELEVLQAVSSELRAVLESYPGIFNVSDSLQSPRDEIELSLKPAAENLGVSLADLALQVRRAFYGGEAQRIPRTREDVKVMVRYPAQERVSIESLNDMRIRTADGREVPFETVAEVRIVPGYLTIDRLQRKRTLEVSAEVRPDTSNPRAVIDEILHQHLPRWRALYPGLSVVLDGELQEEQEFSSGMVKYMALSMLIIYGLMAIPFRSYWQPLLILTAVPFGIMGAIFGHLLLGWQVSMMSMLGVLACSGVVVNDNLVLIVRLNELRDGGVAVLESLLQAAEDRFRPIILTSLTTFIGLLPMMLETNPHAAFLIPMVISLAFGVLFATGVTLILVPS
ncbi:MAG: efflux RND transporter permease subunit, partial [Gammaproteobacteria bacterium]|nr:efflux RND transporter permease subunit [Gammaproteobacteria bacterium]